MSTFYAQLLDENLSQKRRIEDLEKLLHDQENISKDRRNRTQVSSSVDVASADKDEKIAHLEAQLLMYREDFELERRDRERAQSRIADLELQLFDEKQKHRFPQNTRVVGGSDRPCVFQTDGGGRVEVGQQAPELEKEQTTLTESTETLDNSMIDTTEDPETLNVRNCSE